MDNLLKPLLVCINLQIFVLVVKITVLHYQGLWIVNLHFDWDTLLVSFKLVDIYNILNAIGKGEFSYLLPEVSLT